LGASKSLLKLTCFLGTGSQTVQADLCTDMFRYEPRLCIRVTVLSVVSKALPCKQQKCFLFCSVKCVTSLCHSLVSVLLPLCLKKCLNHPDTFCYVCGELTFKSQRRNFTPLIKKCYELYFGCKVGYQDKYWAPYICCVTWVGKRFTSHAVRCSYGSEGTKIPFIRLLLLFNKHNRDYFQVQTYS
jgi:hypothetical protein